MKPPALASTAPAPTIAIAGDEATALMRAIIAAVLSGSTGRRRNRRTKTTKNAPATTFTTITQVFGVDEPDAAESPSTKAAATPMANIALSAPR